MTTNAALDDVVRHELAGEIVPAIRMTEEALDIVSAGDQVPYLVSLLATNAHCRQRRTLYTDETIGTAVGTLLWTLDSTEKRLLAACRREHHDDSPAQRAATQATIRRACAMIGFPLPGAETGSDGAVAATPAVSEPFRANRERSPSPTPAPVPPAPATAPATATPPATLTPVASSQGTRYPTTLPRVPLDRWGIRLGATGGDVDEGTAWVEFTAPNATSAQEAELQVLARFDYDYEDDVRGAVAVATASADGFLVRVKLARAR